MSDKMPLRVVLCWHMHQPSYRSVGNREYLLPWVYLHAIKDYIDMAALIEASPGAKAVINFAPILLEQIDDYCHQIRSYLENGTPIFDPLLASLAGELGGDSLELKRKLITNCLKANDVRLVQRFEDFARLVRIAKEVLADEHGVSYVSDEFLRDLAVWYHLAWLGETVRRDNERVNGLMEKQAQYNKEDCQTLLRVILELMEKIVPRYKQLAEKGQIELSFTPYAHPIIPLMLDLKSAEEAMPKVHLPATAQYPGGEQRSLWHIERGIEVFEQFFKRKPDGCWPSEGSVSDATLRLCDKMGIRWIASGENVMRNSLAKNQKLKSELENECTHRPYKINDCNTVCFFRDDGLSDLIGFTYSDWHADDAVNNFIHHLENIYKACKNPQDSVVSVILDGENAWEHYPENGYYFLSTLYKRLTEHPHIQLTTFSKVLDENTNPVNLNHITAGSWVYGTFSTWIGDPDKNKGWDLLIAAKHVYDRVLERGELSEEQRRLATQQLAICEGSDWFWWFGDYNPAASVNDFDRLYRYQLKELYKLLKEPIPPELDSPISVGGGTPEGGGAMRRGSEV